MLMLMLMLILRYVMFDVLPASAQVGAAFGPASSRVAALWYWASCTTDNALYAILFPHYLEHTLMLDLGRNREVTDGHVV